MSKKNNKTFKKFTKIGWLAIIGLAMVSYLISLMPIFSQLGISPLIISVVLGSIIGNVFHKTTKLLHKTNVIKISTKEILRLGIILYGFRITINDIVFVGSYGLFMAFVVVFSTFVFGCYIGKVLKLDIKSSILISSGSSICGAAAVLATDSIIKGGSDKTAVAICTVVVFGTILMFMYPLMYKLGFIPFTLEQMGYFMGLSLHEVAHAVAAGSAVGGTASDITVIMKMLRVLMLVPFLLIIGLVTVFITNTKHVSIKNNIPYFAIWFLVCVLIGSLLPIGLRDTLIPFVNVIDTLLLTVAMASLGFTIHRNVLKNAGLRPFMLAFFMMLWLFFICFVLVIFK